MRIRLDIAYDGTHFRGWARQPGLRTVQGDLETALERIVGGSPRLVVAGTVLTRGARYQLRDPDGRPITARAAKALIHEHFTVPKDIRQRARARTAATHRSKLTR